MLNSLASILPTVQQMRQPQPVIESAAVNNVFKVFHGFYGNLFLSKFATGQLDEHGQDKGVISARQIWAHGLREFDGQTVKTAIAQCMERYPEFPASLPQLVALCKANKPRPTYKPEVAAIGMGQQLRSVYAAKCREINERHAQRLMNGRLHSPAPADGLDGLKQAIANAVAAAGGDEVRELLRLDVLLAPKHRAAA